MPSLLLGIVLSVRTYFIIIIIIIIITQNKGKQGRMH